MTKQEFQADYFSVMAQLVFTTLLSIAVAFIPLGLCHIVGVIGALLSQVLLVITVLDYRKQIQKGEE